MSKPIVEIYDVERRRFITFDNTKNDPENAVRIADVTSESRKAWLRVMHDGKEIVSYDRRKSKKEKKNVRKSR